MSSSRRFFYGLFWIALYLLLLILPLFVAQLAPSPKGRSFAAEFSMALGFVALSMLSLQFVITARIRPITECYGIDIVLQFHKMISFLIVALVLLHPIILFVNRPQLLSILNPFTMALKTFFAIIATFCLFGIVLTSIFRRAWSIDYEVWRVLHWVLSVAIIIFSFLHVIYVGHYVNSAFKQVLWGTMGVVVLSCLLYTRKIKPILLAHKPWRLTDIRKEADRCWTITLEAVGHEGLKFLPGQLAWLILGRSPLIFEDHPFTMSSSAAQKTPVAFTIKELGDYTGQIADFPLNSLAYIDGPFGSFTIDYFPKAPGAVFIAGGIGVTPMISMLRTLKDRGDKRPFFLFYGIKNEEHFAFEKEVKNLEEDLNLQLIVLAKDPSPNWKGIGGLVTEEVLRNHLPENANKLEYFICGPPPMSKDIKKSLKRIGIPYKKVHSELFELV